MGAVSLKLKNSIAPCKYCVASLFCRRKAFENENTFSDEEKSI